MRHTSGSCPGCGMSVSTKHRYRKATCCYEYCKKLKKKRSREARRDAEERHQ